MAKLIVLQGPPASGKSTWARSFALDDKGTVIVSRDAIRHSLGGEYWQTVREGLVSQIEDAMMRLCLGNKYDVINDGMNLSPARLKHLKAIADEADVIFETKELYCDFWTAVDRDNNADRLHHVGESEIRRIYQRYWPEKLAAELAEHPTAPVVIDADRLMTLPDGKTMRIPNASDLGHIKKMASLRFSIGEIARMLGLPVDGLRMLMNDKESDVWKMYDAGRLESNVVIREKVRKAAESGDLDCIKILKGWERKQEAEELGCYM